MRYTVRELANMLAANPELATEIEVEASLAARPVAALVESERELQAAIFAEVERRSLKDKRWRMVVCIPLGQYRQGQRPEPGLGWSAGFPDLFVFHRNRGYAGMAIELKVGRNKTTALQNEWIGRLNESGYYAVVCRGYEAAMEELIWYMGSEVRGDRVHERYK